MSSAISEWDLPQVQARMDEIRNDPITKKYSYLEPHYQDVFTAKAMIPRIMVVALFAIALVVFGLLVTGHLFSFPQDFVHFFQQLSPARLAIGLSVTLSLLSGVFAIIHCARMTKEELLAPVKVTCKKNEEMIEVTSLIDLPPRIKKKKDEELVIVSDKLLLGSKTIDVDKKGVLIHLPSGGNPLYYYRNDENQIEQGSFTIVRVESQYEQAPARGALRGLENHLETVRLKNSERGIRLDAYIDKSTLDENGNGKAFLYHTKRADDHYMIASVVAILGTPVYLIGVIVYNLIRAIIAPLYVIFRLLQEACTGKPVYQNERHFKVTDIGVEFIQSIKRVIQAPFFALAYWMAVVYAQVNPMGGRKLAAAIERDWNDGMTIEEGYWSIGGEMTLWQFEGGGGPEGLGRNAFFLAGCYQPLGVAEVKNGEIKSYWIAALTNPNKFVPYETAMRSEIEPQFKSLYAEYQELREREKELSTQTT